MRRAPAAGLLLRGLRHRVRVYQGVAGILLALGCSGGAPTPTGSASDGLVFVRRVDGSRDLAWARLSDGAVYAITRTPGREESWPYWSPHARCVVFQVVAGPGRSNLMLWSPGDGEQPLVATRRDERWPAWSPVAAQLVYAFTAGHSAAGLGLVDVGGGPARLLADAGSDHLFLRPSWSPDGRRLVFQRRRRGDDGASLSIVAPGVPARPLTDDPEQVDTKAWFTRDGARIVFSRRPRGGAAGDVWIVDADGGDPHLLVGGPDSDENSGRPSPTRDELAFVSDRSGRPQIWLAGIDGSRPHQLSDLPGGAWAPRWSPDGERLVVTTNRSAERPRLANPDSLDALMLRVIDREGRVLFETPGLMPDWMPPWR